MRNSLWAKATQQIELGNLKMPNANHAKPNTIHTNSNDPSEFRFPSGYSLGQWKLVSPIARGTHSEVYRASPIDRGESSTADYAVKVARPDVQPERTRLLLARQIVAARALSAPEIIPVLAADLAHESPHIVMPFISGHNLSSWHEANRSQPLPVILWLARQIAQGLQSMHQNGWVHSDLQPANILINESGHLFLTDLAFAQAIHEIDADFGTGNSYYAAPERWLATPELSPASDIYSFGIIFFELLAGQLPFGCGTSSQYLPENMQLSGRCLRTNMPQIPMAIERVIARLLSRQPSRRPTADELVPVLMALEIETFGRHIQPVQRHGIAA